MNLTANVNYHIQKNEPQAFKFDVNGIEGNIVTPELVTSEVSISDLRHSSRAKNFDDDGITFIESGSNIVSFQEADKWQDEYESEIEALLKRQIDAKEVIVFDHTVRVDDPNAPRKPVRNVHNDYSKAGALERLVDLVGKDRAKEYRDGHFAFVNVWRPIGSVVNSAPLGFIEPSTISPKDWIKIELHYPKRKGQILGVTPNTDHKWFYKSNMTPEEVVIFNTFDNQGRPSLAHSALDVVNTFHQEWLRTKRVRKSIETRSLVRYK